MTRLHVFLLSDVPPLQEPRRCPPGRRTPPKDWSKVWSLGQGGGALRSSGGRWLQRFVAGTRASLCLWPEPLEPLVNDPFRLDGEVLSQVTTGYQSGASTPTGQVLWSLIRLFVHYGETSQHQGRRPLSGSRGASPQGIGFLISWAWPHGALHFVLCATWNCRDL